MGRQKASGGRRASEGEEFKQESMLLVAHQPPEAFILYTSDGYRAARGVYLLPNSLAAFLRLGCPTTSMEVHIR
jgi:hypothetical protein